MGCFSWGVVEHFLIWLVVIVAVLAIVRVLLSLATPPAEFAWILAAAIQIVRIILWAVVVIAFIILVFSLLACVVPLR